MDDIEFMVAETFRHLRENYQNLEAGSQEVECLTPSEVNDELPLGPGIIYHLQKSTSIFVIRTFSSCSIRSDYTKILEHPEDYPSLRLLEGGTEDLASKLRFFELDDVAQAEIIHDQISNRRYPINEEMMCNLSDPGFSWWLTKKHDGFQLAFNLSSVTQEATIKLGPLGDQQMALRSFRHLEALIREAGLELNIQNETNRIQFNQAEEFLLDEIKDLFELGLITDTLKGVFKLLARRLQDHSDLKSLWLYLQELAAMRRFWIQIQYDLESR